MKDLQPDLIDLYMKQQQGAKLSGDEQQLWNAYKVLYPLDVHMLFQDDYLTELAREARKRPSLEKFIEKYNGPLIITYPSEKNTATVKRLNHPIRKIVYAVAASLLFIGSAWLFRYLSSRNETTPVVQTREPAPITPGYDRAILTLADGRQLTVDTLIQAALPQQGATALSMPEAGTIRYQPAKPSPAGTVLMNALTTPRGGTYQVTLSDGTKVWLNADSRLHYPVAFGNTSREVQLEGEAYFEVAHDAKRQFIVRYHDQSVAVYGTQFNIQAYKKDSNLVALVEGKVKVGTVGASINNVRSLKPGEQAVRYKGKLSVSTVENMDNLTGWKNRLFVFQGTPLSEIMRQVRYWYDVDIVYQNDVADEIFVISDYPRDYPLQLLLDNLNATGKVHCSARGRTVFISK